MVGLVDALDLPNLLCSSWALCYVWVLFPVFICVFRHLHPSNLCVSICLMSISPSSGSLSFPSAVLSLRMSQPLVFNGKDQVPRSEKELIARKSQDSPLGG